MSTPTAELRGTGQGFSTFGTKLTRRNNVTARSTLNAFLRGIGSLDLTRSRTRGGPRRHSIDTLGCCRSSLPDPTLLLEHIRHAETHTQRRPAEHRSSPFTSSVTTFCHALASPHHRLARGKLLVALHATGHAHVRGIRIELLEILLIFFFYGENKIALSSIGSVSPAAHRYIQFRAEFSTDDDTKTSRLTRTNINYSSSIQNPPLANASGTCCPT